MNSTKMRRFWVTLMFLLLACPRIQAMQGPDLGAPSEDSWHTVESRFDERWPEFLKRLASSWRIVVSKRNSKPSLLLLTMLHLYGDWERICRLLSVGQIGVQSCFSSAILSRRFETCERRIRLSDDGLEISLKRKQPSEYEYRAKVAENSSEVTETSDHPFEHSFSGEDSNVMCMIKRLYEEKGADPRVPDSVGSIPRSHVIPEDAVMARYLDGVIAEKEKVEATAVCESYWHGCADDDPEDATGLAKIGYWNTCGVLACLCDAKLFEVQND